MNANNKPNAPKRPTLAEEVAKVESLSDDEVDAELDRFNIDPEPAITKVKSMVQDKLADWKRRGILHDEKKVVHAGHHDE